jgi:general secretion pathway protein G
VIVSLIISSPKAIEKASGQSLNTLRHQSARQNNSSRGFTLLELLVVIVIIGLLAAYVGPRYFAQLGKSETKVAKAQIESFGRALDTYRLDVGHYPSTEQGLNALQTKPNEETKWQGPYLVKAAPLDPWGKPYIYRSPGQTAEFDLLSYGKDHQPGGEGDNADVSYR